MNISSLREKVFAFNISGILREKHKYILHFNTCDGVLEYGSHTTVIHKSALVGRLSEHGSYIQTGSYIKILETGIQNSDYSKPKYIAFV